MKTTAPFRSACAALLLLGIGAPCAANPMGGPYSKAQDDPTNPHDPPVPGFVGPHGDGAARLILPAFGIAENPGNYHNPAFAGWAAEVVAYAPAPGVAAMWAQPAHALGPVAADNLTLVSLGDLSAAQIAAGTPPGSITLRFDRPIRDGPGPDFVVFENGFRQDDPVSGTTGFFAELAFVEVSSDGAAFARFPATSLTPEAVGPFGGIDPTAVYNLAGKHANAYGQSWGTPFDLAALEDHPLVLDGTVDLSAILYLRLVDIPGDGSFTDAAGRPIHDAWPTFGSGGFDLDAVGAIHQDLTYAHWVSRENLSGPEASPDHDSGAAGWPNLFRYATGLGARETAPGPLLRLAAGDDGLLHLRWRRDLRAADLHITLEHAALPGEWTALATSEAGAPFATAHAAVAAMEETPLAGPHGVFTTAEVRLVLDLSALPNPTGFFRIRLDP